MRVTTIDFRPALRVLISDDMPPGEVVREGEEVVIRLPGTAPEDLALPAVERPLEGIRVEREEGGTILRVKVAPEVPFEASHEPGMLTVVFGEQPAPELRGPVTPELYRRLFPTGAVEGAPPEEEEAHFDRGRTEGLSVGRVTLRPYLSASWVDADVLAFDNPTPVRDQYLQVVPGVTASMPVRDGRLAAEYEPRLRFLSDIPQVNETSHFAGLARHAGRQPGAPAARPPLHPGHPRDDGGRPRARVLLRPLALHLQRDDRRSARGRSGPGSSPRRRRAGAGPASTEAGGAASSTTTTARSGPAWATMWGAT